jgi:hypothetical protein
MPKGCCQAYRKIGPGNEADRKALDVAKGVVGYSILIRYEVIATKRELGRCIGTSFASCGY